MPGAGQTPNDRLDSWKEIAAYLGRTVRTVHRWEQSAGLPVYRHGGERGSVYAYKSELDEWLRKGRAGREEAEELFPARPPRRWRWIIPGTALLLLIAAGAWRWGSERGKPPALKVVPLTTYPGAEIAPALSRDGNQLAFAWNGPNQDNFDIYVKLVDGGSLVRLTTDPVADFCPAFSPDGRRIAFRRADRIYVVPALGGVERRIATSMRIHGAEVLNLAWSADGKWLAFEDRDRADAPSGIFLVSVDTGERRRLTTPPAGLDARWGDKRPTFSFDGRNLAFARGGPITSMAIFVLPLTPGGSPAGEPRRLTPDGANPAGLGWTPDGRGIVYCGPDGVMRIPADGRGASEAVLNGVRAYGLSVAPLGSRAAYGISVTDTNIWRIAALGNAPPTRLIESTLDEFAPEYSPDGARIVFTSNRSGNRELWVCDHDGANPIQLTSFGGPVVGSSRWSPDGRLIAFNASPGGRHALYVVPAGGGKPVRLTTGRSNDAGPAWSPDGRWIYFRSDRTGNPQIWRMPAGGGDARQITRNGREEASASPDGAAIYYVQSKEPGIWRLPPGGGDEVRVLEQGLLQEWALSATGIYLLRRNPNRVEFYPFGAGRPARTLEFPAGNRFGSRALRLMAVSPDERWILYSQIDREEADLMLIENFR